MNIFALDQDFEKAARYHCDKHVVKMILETAQMVSTVFDNKGEHRVYMLKPCFQHHPCTKWADTTYENLSWLINLGICLIKEYERRYGKSHVYALLFLEFYHIKSIIKDKFRQSGLQPFALAMPDYIKDKAKENYSTKQAVAMYREYYLKEKSHFAVWKNTSIPRWFK